eukprot:COSAG05_NODE_511_length_9092_cov_6.078839_12_plen_117_part_00
MTLRYGVLGLQQALKNSEVKPQVWAMPRYSQRMAGLSHGRDSPDLRPDTPGGTPAAPPPTPNIAVARSATPGGTEGWTCGACTFFNKLEGGHVRTLFTSPRSYLAFETSCSLRITC